MLHGLCRLIAVATFRVVGLAGAEEALLTEGVVVLKSVLDQTR